MLTVIISLVQVYESVLAWVRHDPRKRSQLFGQIMEFVRLPLVTQDYLVRVRHVCVLGNDVLHMHSSRGCNAVSSIYLVIS